MTKKNKSKERIKYRYVKKNILNFIRVISENSLNIAIDIVMIENTCLSY